MLHLAPGIRCSNLWLSTLSLYLRSIFNLGRTHSSYNLVSDRNYTFSPRQFSTAHVEIRILGLIQGCWVGIQDV